MSDEENSLPGAQGFGFEIPAHVVAAMTHGHDQQRVRAQDRYNLAMSFLDELNIDGLMALRWILRSDEEVAFGNNRFFDGMCVQLLRAKGVDPNTGLDPAAQLLEHEALRTGGGEQQD